MKYVLLIVSILTSSFLFAQTWEELGPAPIARHHPISFAIDGKGYSVSGTSALGLPTDEVYEYDPVTDSWTSLNDFPGGARSFGIGTVTNGIAYLGFGATNFQYLNDLWSFVPSTGTWTQLANCPCSGRRHPAMISIGNKIYVGLGDDPSGDLNDWYMYNIDTDSWIQTANLPGPQRHHPFMFNAGGEVFAGLGHGGPIVYKDWYKLDTLNNTWTALNDFPGEARVAGTQFSFNGYGYVLSGDGDNHNYMDNGEMWRYDPSDDSWVQFPSHPGRSRWAPGSFVIDDDIYFFGGLDRFTSNYPLDVWKYADTTSIMDTTATSLRQDISQQYQHTFIYPNPTTNALFWKSDSDITEVKLYNTLGQLLSIRRASAQQMSTAELQEGMYIVQFYIDSKPVKTSKVIIRRE